MRKAIQTFLRAFATGLLIGMGGIVYLSCDNRYVGAALFGTGLFVVLTFGFDLFTGKVGYALERERSYIGDLGIIWLGNLAGTALTALMTMYTRISAIGDKAADLCRIKLEDSLFSLFLLAVFCGMLMFIAAEGYKRIDNPVAKIMAVFLPVMVFILCGFEHCVADMVYFSAAKMWSVNAFIRLLLMTAGNSVGGIAFALLRKNVFNAADSKISKNDKTDNKNAA
ncbi:MAG: formate/nitrite transporter family protein [Ruminococcus sp.]|nr:formate/nitrite transporter family protein [Ruminococcus sp.]